MVLVFEVRAFPETRRVMPGTKSRTTRRKKRWARGPTARKASEVRSTPSAVAGATTATETATTSPSTTIASPSTPRAATASKKKLSVSPYISTADFDDDSSSEESEREMEGHGVRLFELDGLKSVFQGVRCGECGEKGLVYREDFSRRQGLYTAPYLLCESCNCQVSIPFSSVGTSKVLCVNRKAVFANKCAGGSAASLQMLFSMLDLPLPVSKNVYTAHLQEIEAQAKVQAQDSRKRARDEIRSLYGSVDDGDVIDVLVSCDGTWQRRGFSSLFGAVFIIAYETGKVMDYVVKSKFCKACKHWEKQDKTTEEYRAWQESHAAECDTNFSGSAGAMEPKGTLEMFQSSLSHGLRYKWLISDGDSKTHSLLLQKQPYGEDQPVEKMDCVGHVQKRMGTALRNLMVQYRGQKLADGKTIGGAGRLTDKMINSLQNYYGDAIRKNKGDVQAMMKGVQATLLHCNSTNEQPRHHLCPVGPDSWCKWQVAQATGKVYNHKEPLPDAIVQLIRPIYTRLGSRSLLGKCVQGYTQNANEALHSTVWKFCPKELFMGKTGVETACALAVCCFNDGSSSLTAISDRLQLTPSPLSKSFLRKKDLKRLKKSEYNMSEGGKKLRRLARRKRKGLDDHHQQREGVVYAAGAFDSGEPGSSKGSKTVEQ